MNKVESIIAFYNYHHDDLLLTLSLIIVFYLSQIYLSGIKKIILFAIFAIAGVAISLIAGIFEFHLTLNSLFSSRISGLAFHPINFGVCLMIGFFLVALLFFYVKNRYLKFSAIFLLFFLFLLIISNRTRTIWLALSASVLFSFIILIFFDQQFRLLIKENIRKILLFTVFTATLIFFIFYFWDVPLQRFSDITALNSKTSSSSIRLLEWKTAIKVIENNNIFFGGGPESLKYTYPLVRLPEQNNHNEWQMKVTAIRSVYINMAANIGLVPTLAFIFFLSAVFIYSVKMLISADKNKKALLLMIFIAWFSLLIFLFFYYYSVTSAIFFWALSGVLVGQMNAYKILPKKTFTLSFVTVYVKYFLLFILGIIFVYLLLVFKAEIDFGEAKIRPNTRASMEKIKNSLTFTPYDARKLKTLSSTQLNFAKNTDESIKHAKQALAIDPGSAEMQSFVGYIYFKTYLISHDKSMLRLSKSFAEKAFLLDPTDILYADDLGEYYLAEGNLDEAEKMFRQELLLKKDYYLAYYHLGEVYKQRGKFDEAIKWYQDSLQYGGNPLFAGSKINEMVKLPNE